MGEILFFFSSLPNYLEALLVTPLVHWLNYDSYWSIVPAQIYCSLLKDADKRKHFCGALKYCMFCLFTEIYLSLDGVILEQC